MWRWAQRLRARARLKTHVGVWYHHEYAAPGLALSQRVPNLVPERGERVLGRLATRGLIRPSDVRAPRMASHEELGLVHPPTYLELSLTPSFLGRVFGIPSEHVDVDTLLRAQRRAVGGTAEAAAAVATGLLSVAVNLGGGFHHAEPEQGSGFCVYNDIAVAIAELRRGGYRDPVAIVDLDFHQGNGNLVAFADDPSVLTYSIDGAVWTHVSGVASREVLLAPHTDDATYLEALQDSLPPSLQEHHAGLVFFIAGNDVLAGDALGDFRLTPAGVLERDRFVVEAARALGAGVVVTLGGGYSANAWQCTTNFMRWLLTGEARATRHPETPLRREFRHVAEGLSPIDLQHHTDELSLTEEDVLGDLTGRRQRLVLDYYTNEGIELALERYGLLPKLRARGFERLRLGVDAPERQPHTLRIYGVKAGATDAQEHLLVELVAQRRRLEAPATLGTPLIELLSIEWLLLQDPTREFTLERPQMPGQTHPGLGLAEEMQELLVRVCHRLELEGIVARPAHYHNALLALGSFEFMEPHIEGRFQAMRRVLAQHTIPEAARLVERGAMALEDGTPLRWEPADHVLAVSDRLKRYFASPAYREAVLTECNGLLSRGLHVA